MLNKLAEDAENNAVQMHFPQDLHAFVTKFANINVYRNEVVGDTIHVGAVSGGSRDPPSRWLYHCVNAPACKITFISRHTILSLLYCTEYCTKFIILYCTKSTLLY